MISINLIRGGLPASEKNSFEVLCKTPLDRPSASNLAALPPSLHPRLMERLLGKSPLRLVLARTQVGKGIWEEKLECGHEVTAYQFLVEDENNRLVRPDPIAKRRRCQKCKSIVAPVLKTKAEITADQQRAELTHKQKLKFGSLFAVMCFENGELRPGQSAEELQSALALPSPKKPVQSVKRNSKEDAA